MSSLFLHQHLSPCCTLCSNSDLRFFHCYLLLVVGLKCHGSCQVFQIIQFTFGLPSPCHSSLSLGFICHNTDNYLKCFCSFISYLLILLLTRMQTSGTGVLSVFFTNLSLMPFIFRFFFFFFFMKMCKSTSNLEVFIIIYCKKPLNARKIQTRRHSDIKQ